MKNKVIILLVFLSFSCKSETKPKLLTAEEIVNKSIEVSGGERFKHSIITFDFRDIKYKAKRNASLFVLTRTIFEDNDTIYDVLNNKRFERYINDQRVQLADSMASKYTASVNSVHYFSVLPFGLNDNAVNKTLIGEEQIKTQDYFKLKVTFSKDGGGEDYEDVFVYWINKQSFKVDYLAYSYNEEDGIGMRFRAAYNERYLNGLRFVDYDNYKFEADSIPLVNLGKAFDKNQLSLLSKIELKNIEVNLINN
jgi:hypothetical protein